MRGRVDHDGNVDAMSIDVRGKDLYVRYHDSVVQYIMHIAGCSQCRSEPGAKGLAAGPLPMSV